MISIDLKISKNILKLAMLATLTYLLFNITSNYNIIQYRNLIDDTVVVDPAFMLK